jgi:hypothetical protein
MSTEYPSCNNTIYILFSSPWNFLQKRDNILGYKASLNKYKKTEITPYKLSDHSAIKLELNNKSSRKYTNSWWLNNVLLNNWWVIE